MGAAANNKVAVGRAAAVLTTAEVAGNSFIVDRAHDSQIVVDLSFTIGSLTNVIVRFYGSQDNTTFDPIAVDGGDVMTETLTGSAERMYVVPRLAGVRFFRVSVQGTGTVTSSSCAFDYLYDKLGSR